MIQDLNQLLKRASSGDEEAIQTLLSFFKEQTIFSEVQQEIHLFLKAQKSPHAIYLRGLLYEYGYGVNQNLDMSFLLMREAAAKGHAKATYEVGRHYLEGLGIAKNEVNALEWLTLAAGSPHYVADAMFALGRLYEEGLGVEADRARAQEWYKKAAEKGHLLAKGKID